MTGGYAASDRVAFLLAPGAGASSRSPWMRAWARRLATLGRVRALDYPYQKAGRAAPDRLPVLLAAYRAALARLAVAYPRAGIVLTGKSMGARIGCLLAEERRAAGDPVAGAICFGFPLRSVVGRSRAGVLLALRTPVLFVQGSRDPLCDLSELARIRRRMPAGSGLFVVEGGDHSLQVGRRALAAQGRTQADWDAAALAAVAAFVASLPGGPGVASRGR